MPRPHSVNPLLVACLMGCALPCVARADSVVPSEVCVDGDAVQLLSYDELRLEDPRAAQLARQAGILQSQGRAALAVGFLAGTAATVTGLTFAIVGATTERPTTARRGLGFAAAGLGVGVAGIFGGRSLNKKASALASEGLDREADAMGTEMRWRTDAYPCDNE